MAAQVTLVPRDAFECSPSMRDGVSSALELRQRAYGCQLIQKAGVLLSLQAVTVASGQAIFHRFYFRRSLRAFDVRKIAASSLWLACKIEEDPRRVLHLVNVFHFLEYLERRPEAHRLLDSAEKESLDPFILEIDSAGFKELRAELIRCERYVLRELGFMVAQTLVHPHRFILHYIHALFKSTPQVETSRLCQLAWGYLNDSMMTVLCCEVHPAVIAVGSIYLAASDLEIALPEDTRWYELFDVTWEDVVKVCSTIRESYTWSPVEYTNFAPKVHSVKQEEKAEVKRPLVKQERGNQHPTDAGQVFKRSKTSPGSTPGSAHDNYPKPSGSNRSANEGASSRGQEAPVQTDTSGGVAGSKDRGSESSQAQKSVPRNPDSQSSGRDGELHKEDNEKSGDEERSTSRLRKRSRSRSLEKAEAGPPEADRRGRGEQNESRVRERHRDGDLAERSRDRPATQSHHSPPRSRHRDSSLSPGKPSRGDSPDHKQFEGDEGGRSRSVAQNSRVSQSDGGSPKQREAQARARGSKSFAGGPGKAAGSDSRITFKPRVARSEAGPRNGGNHSNHGQGGR